MKLIRFEIALISLLLGTAIALFIVIGCARIIADGGYKTAMTEYAKNGKFRYDYKVESTSTETIVIIYSNKHMRKGRPCR